MSLKERGAITGIGETAYSRNSGKSVVALQMEAELAAIADAGLAPTDIDGVIAYTPREERLTTVRMMADGLTGQPRRG